MILDDMPPTSNPPEVLSPLTRPLPPAGRSRRLDLLYALWLAAAVVVQLLGYAATRSPRDLFTILAEAAVGTLLAVSWVLGDRAVSRMQAVGMAPALRFLVGGLAAAYASEGLFFLSMASPIPWPLFMLRSLGWYSAWFGAWWWVSTTYHFSRRQVFFLGGFNGFVVEILFLRTVPLSPLALFAYPLTASLYGAMLLVAHAVWCGTGALTTASPPRVPRFAASLLPLLAYLPGAAWFALVQVLFRIDS